MFSAFPLTLETILITLVTGGVFMTPRHSAGPHTPAVSDGYTWAVHNLQGSPVVLAHNPFDAALWLLRLETGEIALSDRDAPACLMSDAEMEESHKEERLRYL